MKRKGEEGREKEEEKRKYAEFDRSRKLANELSLFASYRLRLLFIEQMEAYAQTTTDQKQIQYFISNHPSR